MGIVIDDEKIVIHRKLDIKMSSCEKKIVIMKTKRHVVISSETFENGRKIGGMLEYFPIELIDEIKKLKR